MTESNYVPILTFLMLACMVACITAWLVYEDVRRLLPRDKNRISGILLTALCVTVALGCLYLIASIVAHVAGFSFSYLLPIQATTP